MNLYLLLSLPDEAFLPAAFENVVGREPDVIGLAHYVERLRSGANRALVLAEMRSSAEGQAHAAHAPDRELDILQRRYRRVRDWPLGRWRWIFLSRYAARSPRRDFDWALWFSHYSETLKPKHASATTGPETENKLAAIERRVDALSAALQQAVPSLRELGAAEQETASIQQAASGEHPPAVPLTEVSWAARSIYAQMLQRIST
ncbi:MAG: DUF4214 domain-containing protein [Acidithiobacillus sp.]